MALRRAERWAGRRFHLGKNNEVFDAEPYALYQAAKTFGEIGESGQRYTIFTDSTAAISRARSGDTRAGQRFAVAIIEIFTRLLQRGNVTIR